jgi:hypothetical protein
MVWRFLVLSPVELSEKGLALSGKTSEKTDYPHV